MNHALDLAPDGVLAQGVVVDAGAQLDDVAGVVFHHLVAAQYVAVAQTHFAAQGQALPASGGHFGKVISFDDDFRADGHFAAAEFRVLRVEVGAAALRAVEVGNHHLERIQHRHDPWRTRFQIVAHGGFQHRHIDDVFALGNADALGEFPQPFWRITTTTHAGNGGHARVVPAADALLVDQLQQLALAGNRVVQLQPGKFGLLRVAGDGDVVQHPVVQRAMVFKFQRAQGMGDAFQCVGNAMRVVVHRVDAPRVAGANVVSAADAVNHRVAQVDIGRGHVDLGAQHHRTIGELTGAHAREQVQIFCHGTVTVGAIFTRLGQRAAIFAHLLRRQIVNVSQPLVNQFHRVGIQLLEIIRRPAHIAVPGKTQPAHIVLNGQGVLFAFLFRVGVVETQIAGALIILRQTEIQANGFGMTDVQIAVRLRRKARGNAAVLAAGQIGVNHVADKV